MALLNVSFFSPTLRRTVPLTVVIPTEAILTAAGEQYVYVVDGTVARKAPVAVGLAGSGVTELLSGVSAGESVVTVGQQYLSDGDAVRIVEGAK